MPKAGKTAKPPKATKASKEAKPLKDPKATKEGKEVREPKASKDGKAEKALKRERARARDLERGPRPARGPLDPKVGKDARKALAAQLRERLRTAPHDMREMSVALEVEPEVVVVALRELRSRKRGRLRSTIRLGHVCWWWEDAPPLAKEEKDDPKPKKAGKKK